MAFVTDTRGVAAKTSYVASFKAALSAYFERVLAARGRTEQIARFEAMTDRQLADIGIKREDIVAYVFRDKFHI